MTNIVQIQLIGLNAGYLEVEDNTAFPLNFSIAEIRDITKKKGTFSKSIKLPGTKVNNQLLNHYFDTNIEASTFNINKLQHCNIIQNGVNILENGLLQLISINKTQTNGNYEDVVSYTVLVKDSTSDFFSKISNKYLSDISGFTWMNHIATADNVVASFTNTIKQGYKYVMPFNPEKTDDNSFDLKEFSPGIYARLYMDKIFANAGYSYNWADMNSPTIEFDKLIIPYNGDVIKTNLQDQAKYGVVAQRTTTTTQNSTNRFSAQYSGLYSYDSSTINQVLMPIEILDPAGLYNPTTSVYTTINLPSNSNNLKFDYAIEYEVYLTNPNSFNVYTKTWQINQNGDVPFDSNELMIVIPRLNATQNGINIMSDAITYDQKPLTVSSLLPYAPGTTMLESGTTYASNTQFGLTPNAQVKITSQLVVGNIDDASDIITNFYVSPTPSYDDTSMGNVFISYKIKSITMKYNTLVDVEYGYNVPVTITRYIPQKIKQSDFLKSIFSMYNLFAEIDKNNPKQINLTTRDKYYDDGKINNWTKKIAKDKTQELKFLPELLTKKLILTYKEDSDFANKTYLNATKEVYGQQEYTFENQYVKDITKQEIIFSPTPMKNTSFGAVCPLWAGGTPKNNIRILFDGGVKSCHKYYIYNYYLDATNNSGIDSTIYPHISHWNKALNPTIDLNFGLCDFYFRTDNYGSNTNNNLFNLYWRRTLNQINNGKLLTAYFNLNEFDIQNVRLSDKIRIDNSWWNINRIIDYDANKITPTKVELISIDDNLQIPFESRTVSSFGKNSNIFDFIPLLANERSKIVNTNLSTSNIMIQGKHNYINENVTTGSIMGNNNIINNDSVVFGNNNVVNQNSNSLIFGSNNIIKPNVNNAIVIGDGFNVTSGSTLYTNNIVIPSGGTINGINVQNVISGGSGIDTYVTGGTYSSGTAIFTNNFGRTFNVTGFPISGGSGVDTYVTGGTYSNGTSTFKNNFGAIFNVTGYSTGYTLTSTGISSALGYTPYNASNPNGYISSITSGNVTTALGYTPYNSSNPNGYISSYVDTYTTGGTHVLATGISTFVNNLGGSFSVSGYSTGSSTGGTGSLTNGTNYLIVKATGTTAQNATEFNSAYTLTASMSASSTNRITILMAPGYYAFSSLVLNKEWVDLASLSGGRDVYISTVSGTIDININDVRISGIDSLTNGFIIGTTSSPLLIMTNCKSGNNSFNGTLDNVSGTFINCISGNQSFGYNALICSGTFINCKAGNESFNNTGYGNTGYFKNCISGVDSFGFALSNATGTGDNAGSYFDCVSGNRSFGYGCYAVSGFFFNSKAGSLSFGSNSNSNTGTFIDCIATANSFGSNLAATSLSGRTNTGNYSNCIGDTQSFGYNQNFNGISNNCIASTDSFGGGTFGALTGKLYYSKLTLGTFKTVSSAGRTIYCIDGSDTPNNQ